MNGGSDLLINLRSEAKKDAEAAWSGLNKVLILGLTFSAMIFVLTLGYFHGQWFPKYVDALNHHQKLAAFVDSKRDSKIKEQDWSKFLRFTGGDFLVLGNVNLRDAFKELQRLWKKQDWPPGYPIGPRETLLGGATRIHSIAINLRVDDVNKIGALLQEIKTNKLSNDVRWENAELALQISEAVDKVHSHLSTIRRDLRFLGQLLSEIRLQTTVEKEIQTLKIDEILDNIRWDLDIVRREITSLRVQIQGVEFLFPVLACLYWYPVILVFYSIWTWRQVIFARERSAYAVGLSTLLKYGNYQFNERRAGGAEDKVPWMVVSDYRFPSHQWVVVILIAVTNLAILWHLNELFGTVLNQEAVTNMGADFVYFGYGFWLSMVILGGLLMLGGLVMLILSSRPWRCSLLKVVGLGTKNRSV